MFRMFCHFSTALPMMQTEALYLKGEGGEREEWRPLGPHQKEEPQRAVPELEMKGVRGQRVSGGAARGVVSRVRAAQSL